MISALVVLCLLCACGKKEENLSFYERDHDEPIFMMLADDNPEVVAAKVKARQSLRQFRQAIVDQKHPRAFFNVKGYFPEQDGSKGAHLWLVVRELKDEGYVCSPFELPPGFTGLKSGQKVVMTDDKIEDWMILDGGVLYGGYSLRLQRAHVPDGEKDKYDRFIGVEKYSEVEP